MITHHLDIATLISCSAGSQPEALAAVTAAHLAVCPSCTTRLSRAQTIGEAIFDALPGVPLTKAIPTPTSALNQPLPKATSATIPHRITGTLGDVPLPLVCTLGYHLADIEWDKVTAGVWTAPVPLSENGVGQLHLLKLAPGVTQPSAKTPSSKLMMVLSGSYLEGGSIFVPGDVADFDDHTHRNIAADAQTGCVCLVAVDR